MHRSTKKSVELVTMLLRFRFANFRSFRDEQELSFIASNLNDSDEGIFRPDAIPEGVLPAAAIYGANASGKSNVLKALAFMQRAVTDSHRLWEPEGDIPIEAFAGDNFREKPSEFEADFLSDGIRHQYGFSLNSRKILNEWLIVYPNGHKQTWFKREYGERMVFSQKLAGPNRSVEELTRPNSLFLSCAAQNSHKALSGVHGWFAKTVDIIDEDIKSRLSFTIKVLRDMPEFALQAKIILEQADVGIHDFEIKKIPESGRIININQFTLAATSSDRLSLIHHMGGDRVAVSIKDESRGTVALLGLLAPLIVALETGYLLYVDELDASLHTHLAIALIKRFTSSSNKNQGQLLFNTHDTNLLSADVLRRDQVWLTEKDKDGASTLYPLTDFKPRAQENLEKGYLQGRYGAIPFINADEFFPVVKAANGKKR